MSHQALNLTKEVFVANTRTAPRSDKFEGTMTAPEKSNLPQQTGDGPPARTGSNQKTSRKVRSVEEYLGHSSSY